MEVFSYKFKPTNVFYIERGSRNSDSSTHMDAHIQKHPKISE